MIVFRRGVGPDQASVLTAKYNHLKAKIDTIKVKLTDRVATYNGKLDALKAREAKVSQREADVAAKEHLVTSTLNQIHSTSFGAGVWQVGTDIVPGIYRAVAGGMCYWAVLNSANTNDIANNGGFSANQTVTLSAGHWFDTSNCGTWHKIG